MKTRVKYWVSANKGEQYVRTRTTAVLFLVAVFAFFHMTMQTTSTDNERLFRNASVGITKSTRVDIYYKCKSIDQTIMWLPSPPPEFSASNAEHTVSESRRCLKSNSETFYNGARNWDFLVKHTRTPVFLTRTYNNFLPQSPFYIIGVIQDENISRNNRIDWPGELSDNSNCM